MGRILIITIRAKGGGAEKIIQNIINLDTNEFKWINMESFLGTSFLYRYAKFMLLICKNIGDSDKILLGSEGILGFLVFPFKIFYKKKFILWNHCYFNDYKEFLSKKNKILYRISYALYPLRINASPASESGTFIPNPYSFLDFCSANMFLSKKEIILLSISSLAELKRVDLTIELLRSLPANIRLNIYGEGIEKNNLENLVNQYGISDRARFLGFRQNPFDFDANDARILIINSKTEALPTIILESVERFVPVIVCSYTGVEYWQNLKSVFVLEKITSEKILEIIDCLKKLSDSEYADLFISDINKLKKQHSYDNFIDLLETF